jgi:hypothetical protein
MKIEKSRDSRGFESRGTVRLGLLIGLLAIAVALTLTGCGKDEATTTTTTAPEPTTITTAPEETTTTTTAVETTTSATAPEETTTTSLEETTTTTEKLSSAETRLPNGHIKAMGFIDKVWEEGGKRYLRIDYAEMLTGQEAIDAAVAAGFIQPGEDLPNDYYIRNTNPQKRTFEVSSPIDITTSTWDGVMEKPVNWGQFLSFWSSTPPDGAAHLHEVPWWIERDGPVVIKIDEQYLP